MKNRLKALSALALAAPLTGCVAEKEQNPNIVLFLIDDMGWLDTSVAFGEEVYPFNMRHDTPNLSVLAEKGAIMSSAYVCPVSTPTRTSIMSGMNAAHTRITNYTSVDRDWNPDATDTPEAQENTVQSICKQGISQAIITLGSEGCIYNHGCEIKRFPAYKVNAVDTTAAGDTFIGAFCAAYTGIDSLDAAIGYGTAASAISVGRFGASISIPNKIEIENFIKSMEEL